MTRLEFLRKVLRYGLMALLALIVFVLGNRVVTGKNCGSCAGNGICKGLSDCENY